MPSSPFLNIKRINTSGFVHLDRFIYISQSPNRGDKMSMVEGVETIKYFVRHLNLLVQ